MASLPCIRYARSSTGFLSLPESSKLSRQPPVTGLGWVTTFRISAFSAVTLPRMLLGSTDFKLFADQIQNEYFCVFTLCAHTGPQKTCEGCELGSIRSPMQTIGIGMLALGLQDVLRPPEARDIVVDLLLGRNFDQLNRAFAPIPNRLGPQAWPLFKARFDILILPEILLPLHQAETARVKIGKGADLKVSGIAERTPKFLAPPVEYREAIGVVHRWAKIVDIDPIVRPEEKHARHRGESGTVEIDTGVDRHFDVEDRGFTRPYREAIGRSRTLAVQQRMHDDGIGVGGRLFDPERLEQGEFLPLGLAGVDCESPRRQSVDFSFCDGAEIAGAQKNANLVVIIRPFDRRVNPKPCKTQIYLWARRCRAAERKVVRTVGDPGGLAVRNLVDIHSWRVIETAMEELHFEGQFLAAPKRAFGQEAYRTIVIVIQVLQAVWQLGIRRLERFAGCIAGALSNNRWIKRGRRRACRPCEPTRGRRRERQDSCGLKKTSTVQGASKAVKNDA